MEATLCRQHTAYVVITLVILCYHKTCVTRSDPYRSCLWSTGFRLTFFSRAPEHWNSGTPARWRTGQADAQAHVRHRVIHRHPGTPQADTCTGIQSPRERNVRVLQFKFYHTFAIIFCMISTHGENLEKIRDFFSLEKSGNSRVSWGIPRLMKFLNKPPIFTKSSVKNTNLFWGWHPWTP